MKKIGHITITGRIVLKSGIRIGGSDDILQIGGTDLPCIKDPVTEEPYIPGSSLKGRMRSQLEIALGKVQGRDPCGCAQDDCPVCRVFGPHKKTKHSLGPTRILVRDAHLIDGGELELKTESINKRDTGGAEHPRSLERVRHESKFHLEISIQVFDLDNDFKYRRDPNDQEKTGGDALLEVVLHCLDFVQETGIGAGTSKGYGQIDIVDLKRSPKLPRLKLSEEPTA